MQTDSPSPAAPAERSIPKTGAQIIVDALLAHGVDTVFGYTGASVIPLLSHNGSKTLAFRRKLQLHRMRRMLSDIGLHVTWSEERSSSFQSPRLQARVVYLTGFMKHPFGSSCPVMSKAAVIWPMHMPVPAVRPA